MKLDYLKKRFHPEHTVKFCRFEAEEAYSPKKGLTGYDLVAGEPVTLFKDGEIIKEHVTELVD